MSISPLQNPTNTNNYTSLSIKSSTKNTDQLQLTDEEKQKVTELKKRDREVRAHEQAHKAAGGQYVIGGPNFTYVTGPDGIRYANSGEVSIDTSEIPDDPKATARKMKQVQRAALAPLKPSAQDHHVATQAKRNEAEATIKMNDQKSQEENTVQKSSSNIVTSYNSHMNLFNTKNVIDIKA